MRIVALIAAFFALVPVLAYAGGAPEKSAAIDGSQYAVIAPIFTGSDGNLSFLRLINRQGATSGTSAKTTTFSVMVVGSPSGQVYGTAQIEVPAFAAPQYVIGDILSAAGAGALNGGDTGYSLYLQDPDSVAYEHVIFNGTNGFFENVGVCDAGGYINDSGNATLFLPNVHTSVLGTYPSQVFIHNYAATAASYQVNVIDARTGTSIGTVEEDVAANTSVTIPETTLEQTLKWMPDADQPHANLLITNVAGGVVNAIVGQYIYNQQLSAYINMSMGCDPNAVSPTAAATVERVFQGVMAQTQDQPNCSQCQDRSGTFTVYVPTASSGPSSAAGAVISNFNSGGSTPNPATIGDLGPPFALTGSYSADTGQLTLSGSSGAGGATTFTGTVTNGVLTGTYGGNGQISGVFAGLESTLSPVALYCGMFQNNGQAKAFMVATNGSGTAVGITTLNMGVALAGTMSGTATSGTVSGQSAGGGTFFGAIQNGQMTGNYSDAGATFTASACPAAIPVLPSGNAQETVPLYILVNKLGGSGTVTTSNGSTINFTSTDRPPIGTIDTLTATPASGSTFRGWGGACSGSGSTCAVTMNNDEAVSATFCGSNTECTGGGYSAPYTFDLTVSPGGVTGYTILAQNVIDCVNCTSASIALNAGTQFSLNASVPAGTNFAWGGACSGGGTCFVTMNGNTQVTATLKPATTMNNGGGNTGGCTAATGAAGTYALNVTVNQGGTGGFSISSIPSGFSASGNCNAPSASFPAGTTVTLTANGSANQVFMGWGGACSGTGTCVVTMNSNTTVIANYGAAGVSSGGGTTSSGCSTAVGGSGTYTLSFTATLTGTGGYSVVSSPSGLTAAANCNTASESFPAGTSVTLTATGTTNQTFQGWSGACSGTGTCTVVMNANKSVGATFNP